MTAFSPHYFCELRAAEAQRESERRLAIVPLPIGIRAMGEKPCDSFHRYRRVPQQHTPVKKRTPVRLAREIHIDSALQRELS